MENTFTVRGWKPADDVCSTKLAFADLRGALLAVCQLMAEGQVDRLSVNDDKARLELDFVRGRRGQWDTI